MCTYVHKSSVQIRMRITGCKLETARKSERERETARKSEREHEMEHECECEHEWPFSASVLHYMFDECGEFDIHVIAVNGAGQSAPSNTVFGLSTTTA